MRFHLAYATLSLASLSFALPTPSAAPVAGLLPLSTSPEVQDSPDDLSELRAAFDDASRAVKTAGEGYAMRSTASPLVAHFDGRGMSVAPGASGADAWNWGLELTSYGFPGGELAVDQPQAMQAAGNRLAYHWGADLEEWYVNQARGVEHGFTLAQRPGGADPGEQLFFDLRVRGGLNTEVTGAGRDVRFRLPTGETAITYNGLVVFDAKGTKLDASFSSNGETLQLAIDEAAATYPLTIDPVVQQEYLKASNTGSGDRFGWAVDISGDTAVIGAARESSNATGVNGDETNNLANDAGAAYVFVRSGGTWIQQAYLKASNTNADDFFGHDVAIDGDTIAIGAIGESGGSLGPGGNQLDNSVPAAGAVYVFQRTGTTWVQQAYLKASNTDALDSFGESVDISGDRIVVGTTQEDSSASGVGGDGSNNSFGRAGAAYIYTRTGSTWDSPVYLKASSPNLVDQFGCDVAIDGTRVLVGANAEDSAAVGIDGDDQNNTATDSGAAYLFELVGGHWTQVAYLKASNTEGGDRFGDSVDLSGDTLAISAIGENSASPGVNGSQVDNSETNSGAAYVFTQVAGAWTQQAYIKSSNPKFADQFGESIALDGDHLAVGAIGEKGSTPGINGNENDLTSTQAGAAYVYERLAGVWAQTAYVKASVVNANDMFGGSVALSGGTLMVAASREDGGSSGVGGNPADNSQSDSGAVFVYDLASNCGVTAYGPQTGGNVANLGMPISPVAGGKATLEFWNFSGNGIAMLIISTAPNNVPFLDGTLLVDLSQNVFGPGGVRLRSGWYPGIREQPWMWGIPD